MNHADSSVSTRIAPLNVDDCMTEDEYSHCSFIAGDLSWSGGLQNSRAEGCVPQVHFSILRFIV